MKKVVVLLLAMICAGVIWGQDENTEKRKIAVYLTASENVNSEVKRLINNQIITALTRTNRYILIERNDIFVQQIDKERVTQLSGRVSDNQITKLGEGYGAVAVCIVDVGSLKGELSVDMRIVSVEKEIIIHSGFADGRFSENADIRKIVDKATTDMLGGSGSATSGSSSNKRNGEIYNPDGIELIYVEGTGSGIMATKGFYIGKYEITQAQWRAIMGANPSRFKGDNLPVENVSWDDCQAFISKLNAITGKNYYLPTESEWEYAARGGNKSQNYEYSGSNSLFAVAWYSELNGTHAVGTKQPNELGIYDMTGNVWEWCEDWYDASQQFRVYRGGSWNDGIPNCRLSHRWRSAPEGYYENVGFRVALP